jgi:hypothetical protein
VSNSTNETAHLVVPEHAPGKSPKKYNAKKAIGVFVCLSFSYGPRCPELLRARISAKGDIYVIPHTEYAGKSRSKNTEFHISHHKSGKFHWVWDGEHVHPAFGESDYPAAFGFALKVRQPPCFCFRRGKDLDVDEIAILVECLARYLPFKIDTAIACQNLRDVNFSMFHSPDFSRFLKRRKFFYVFTSNWLIKWLKSLKS